MGEKKKRRNESQLHDACEVKQWTRPSCWMTRTRFITVSGESEHRVGKIHKGRASYRGRLLRRSGSGRHGELLCLNHVVDRVWKKLSSKSANVINMPFSVERMNLCVSFYLWGERRGGVEVLLSNELTTRALKARVRAFIFVRYGTGNALILCFVTYQIWLNLFTLRTF